MRDDNYYLELLIDKEKVDGFEAEINQMCE